MNPNPVDRSSIFPTLSHRLELRIVLLHLTMAVHAKLCVRHIRMRGDFNKTVAITTIHSKLRNMNVVRKRYRLDRLITDLGIFRGDVISGAGGEAADYHHAADGQLQWQPI